MPFEFGRADLATGEATETDARAGKDPAAVERGRRAKTRARRWLF
jgi:hypothetical protein